jgi:hypothetical protein
MMSEWLSALEQRHLADLTFSEVARALRALSSNYVERRERLVSKTAFDSAGKRAAYALYYSPLHFLTVGLIADTLRLRDRPVRHILDLGCGTGAAGAAWASALEPPPQITGIDVHPWAVAEAAFTYRSFALAATTKRGDAMRTHLPRSVDAVVAGWTINELSENARTAVQYMLLRAADSRAQVLIVEPIATRVSPWWDDWVRAFEAVGGRSDEWRFAVELPVLLERFDRAAGLRHDQLKARSLFVGDR